MLSIDKQGMPPLVSIKPPLDSTGLGAEEEISEELKMSWQITNTNNPGTAHFCRACMIGFRDRILLEDHVKHDHTDIDGYKFRCLVCQARFPRGELLREHSELCKPVRSGTSLDFICHLCDKSFGQRAHLLIHYSNLHKSFECTLCKGQFASKYDLETHYETVHTLKSKKRAVEGELSELVTQACECGKVFVDEADYKEHVQEEHPGTKPLPWPEQPDGEKTKKRRGRPPRPAVLPKKSIPKLIRSPITKPSEGETAKCPECGDNFEEGAEFKRHMQTVHAHLKPYGCKVCGKRFTRTSDVKRHIECIHGQTVSALDMQKMHKVKPFRCNECSHLFSRYSDIKRHIEAIHAIVFTKETYTYELGELDGNKVDMAPSNEQIKMYKCTLCQLEFRNAGHAKRHVRKVHIKSTADDFLEDIPDDKNLECTFCGDVFSTLDDKQHHIKEAHDEMQEEFKEEFKEEIKPETSDPYDGYSVPTMVNQSHTSGDNTLPTTLGNGSEQTSWYKDMVEQHISFDCPECKRSFTKSRFLQQHIVKMHVSKIQNKVSCTLCKRKYRYQAGLDKHISAVHGKQMARPDINKNISQMDEEEEDDYEGADSDEAGFFCEPCEIEFGTHEEKQAHLSIAHELDYKCQKCNKIFSSSDAWATHQLVAHTAHNDTRLDTCKTILNLQGGEEADDAASEDEKLDETVSSANMSIEYS